MSLIQSNVRHYLCDILLKCHEKKTTIYYWVLNMSVLFIFTMTVGIILFVCYKQKPTDQELRQKMIQDQQYILQQIRFFKDQSASMSNITDLPILYRDDIRNNNEKTMGIYNPNPF